MAAQSKTHVIKVTGLPDEMLRLMDERVIKQHYGGRAEYIRDLIRRDITRGEGNSTLQDILAPIHHQASALSELEIDNMVDRARDEVYSAGSREREPR